MSRSEIWEPGFGKIVVESMVVAIGISVGTEQLGGSGTQERTQGDPDGAEKEKDRGASSSVEESGTFSGHLVMSVCGAVLVSANVAPTQEVTIIGAEAAPIKLAGDSSPLARPRRNDSLFQ